jgi:hypothetical protein
MEGLTKVLKHMLEHVPKHHAQASCLTWLQAMPYARTHALTENKLTFSSYVTFVIAREKRAENA